MADTVVLVLLFHLTHATSTAPTKGFVLAIEHVGIVDSSRICKSRHFLTLLTIQPQRNPHNRLFCLRVQRWVKGQVYWPLSKAENRKEKAEINQSIVETIWR